MRFRVCPSSVPRTVGIRPWFALGAVLSLLLSGCQNRDEIKRYTVKKLPHSERKVAEVPPSREMPAGHGRPRAERMLAAIASQGRTFWLFKLTGPRAAAADQMEGFLRLVQSLKFPDEENGTPTWTLPEGWTEQKEESSSSRAFATLVADAEGAKLPVSVSRFPFPSDGSTEQVPLMIVNVWCEQFGLPEKKQSDLSAEEQPKDAEVRQFDVDGKQVTLVNFVATEAPTKQPSSSSPGQPKWTVPEGWNEAPGDGVSIAAFEVSSDGNRSIRTTVSVLGGGDLLANINRWRGQLSLAPWSREELAKSTRVVSVGGIDGTLVELSGTFKKPGQPEKPGSTLGVIVPRRGQSWFFKLTGDVELAKREKANFEAFVQSVKFE